MIAPGGGVWQRRGMAASEATWFACSRCGLLQVEAAACARCRFDQLIDVRRSSVRDLLVETDQRRLDRASGRNRMIGVVTGMVTIGACWFIPGFWKLRAHTIALPFLADQILLMAVVGLGVLTVLDRREPRTRFPWLEMLPPAERY